MKPYDDLAIKIINTNNAMIVCLDKNHNIRLFNRGAEKLTGYKTKEVIGRDWFKLFFDPESYKEMDREWKQGWGTNFHSHINQIRIKNGDVKNISWQTTGSYENKNNTLLIAIGQDITEYKQVEKKIAENLQFIQALLEAIPSPVFYKDPLGRYLGCNPAFSELFGISQEQLKGKTAKDFWPGDAAASFHKKELALIEDKQHQDYEINLKDKNRITRYGIISKNVFYDDNCQVKGIIGTFTDLTKIKVQEVELKQFAAVIEQSVEEVMITDADGMIQYVNPRFEENTGFSQLAVLGKTPRILKSGFHDPVFYKNLWQTILNKTTWKGKIINHAKDGRQIVYDATITPLLDSRGDITSFVSARRDITEQEKIEKQLQQTHKMEVIGTLAGGIAHDFNNILAGIMGYTELVIEDLEENNYSERTLERLENVMTSANRATELVRQILTFSRSNQEDRHPVNVKSLVKEVTKLLRASLPSTIDIKLSLDSEAYVKADPIHIHQILMNIGTNAKDAMGKTGGRLSISMNDVILAEKDLAGHENTEPGKFLRLCLADTGSGMTDEIIKKSMEPFFTTKPKEQGTGMGLFVVHGIIRSLDGFITLTSEVGAGSQFDIYLPVCTSPLKAPHSSKEKEIRGGSESILFVDDEVLLGGIVQDLLINLGYHVAVFNNSREALEFFKKNHHQYDLVISDIIMPEITGDALAQKMRLIKPDIPFILCTGSRDRIDEQTTKRNQINALLYKPITLKKMALAVREVLDGEVEWQIF